MPLARIRTTGPRCPSGLAGIALATLVLVIGCDALDSLVRVDAASRIQADSLETPENAARLLDGAVGDFECAFSGYVVFMGTFVDELNFVFGAAAWISLDSRNLTESGFAAPHAMFLFKPKTAYEIPGLYKSLSTARFQADHLINLLDQWGGQVPNATGMRATAAAYSGYGRLLLGESMCSAAFDLGPELMPNAILQQAIERFGTTLNAAGSNQALRNVALVGRARAKLDLGDLAGAKADAAQVAPGFQLDVETSTSAPRRENQVYVRLVQTERLAVSQAFRTVSDPRVPVTNTGRVSGNGSAIWVTSKYPSAASPIRLASWVEAQLIIAEADASSGNLAGAVDAINRVRTRAGVALPPFQSTVAADVKAQILAERKAEFFLESQRQTDIRRLDLPLDPPAGSAYPLSGTYGSQRCVPLPLVERLNNPNI